MKTEEALDIAKNTGCLVCGKKPESVKPLSEGFSWDTSEPENAWIFCDKCLGT